jgi:predicted Zn-dependent peptidase
MAGENRLEFEEHMFKEVAADYSFRGTPLGNTTTDPELNGQIDLQNISKAYAEFYDRFFHTENMWMVVGDVKSHDMTAYTLEEVIQSSGFNRPPITNRAKASRDPPLSEFKPGPIIYEKEQDENSPPSIDLYLTWQAVPWNDNDAYVFYVLEWLFGSASDFMEGGPGRGMHSRAPSLIHRLEIAEIDTIFKLFKKTGIFGLHYKVSPEDAPKAVVEMIYQMAILTESITEEELSRAKNSQALKVAMNMERQMERSVELSYNVFVGPTLL